MCCMFMFTLYTFPEPLCHVFADSVFVPDISNPPVFYCQSAACYCNNRALNVLTSPVTVLINMYCGITEYNTNIISLSLSFF